jgi:O-antigen/teichoic acid export membrane protein
VIEKRAGAFRSARDSSTTLAWSIAALVLSLGCGIVTARELGPGDRGILALLITTTSLTALLTGLGTNVAVRVAFPRTLPQGFGAYARLSAFLGAAGVPVLVAVGAVLSAVAGLGVTLPETLALLLPLGITAYASSQSLDLLNAAGRSSAAAAVNAAGTAITLLVLWLTWFADLGVSAAVIAYSIGYLVRSVLSVGLTHRHRLLTPRGADAAGLLSSGWRFMGLNLGQATTYRVNQYVLSGFRGSLSVGIYAVATTPAALIEVVSNSIGQVAFRDAAHGRLTRRAAIAFVAVAVGLTAAYGVILWWVSPWLIPLVFGPGFEPSVGLVGVLALSEVALAPYLVISRITAGLGFASAAGASGVVSLVTMVGLSFLWVPEWGAPGAAWASVVTYSVMSIWAVVGLAISRRRASRFSRMVEDGRDE